MKKQYFASPQIVKSLIMYNILMFIFLELIIFLIGQRDCLMFSIVAAILIIVDFLVSYKKYNNSFVLFKADEIGVHTKYITIKWENVTSYELLEPQIYRTRIKNSLLKVRCPSIVCIGDYKENLDFAKQDKQHCIFFSLTKEHLNLIDQYGKGKSKALDHLLNSYM